MTHTANRITTPDGIKKPRYRAAGDPTTEELFWEAQIEVYGLTLTGRGQTKAAALEALESRVLDATVSDELKEARENQFNTASVTVSSAAMISNFTVSAAGPIGMNMGNTLNRFAGRALRNVCSVGAEINLEDDEVNDGDEE